MSLLKKKLSPTVVDFLWHGIKAVLCTVQVYLCGLAVLAGILKDLWHPEDSSGILVVFLLLAVVSQIIVFAAFQIYYDNNDDRAFDRYCAREDAPTLYREPPYILGMVITVTGATLMLRPALRLLFYALLPASAGVWAEILAWVVAAAIAFLVPFLHLRRLTYVWGIQKNLRRSTDKRIKPFKRVLLAAVFFVAMFIACRYGPAVVLAVGSLVPALFLLTKVPMIVIVCLLVLGAVIHFLRHLMDRRRFMKRLEGLRDRGELSFTVHGHPYRSLFWRRVEFSLTVTDYPHPESRRQTPTTYQVAIANCNRRRMMVLLCENQVFQFVYSLKIRALGPVGAIGMADMGGKLINIPLASFFISHSFAFPEGEGKRILLVDPAPYSLAMRGFREGEVILLDNASELFGYTVFGKNAFLSMLERA